MNIDSTDFSCSNYFTKKGLVFDTNITFHNKNLLIGKNGSGKTRFLKALEEYYKENSSKSTVLTLFFPEIHSVSAETTTASLYDAIYEKEQLNFYDFLRLATHDCLSLIEDIYTGMSIRAKKSAQRMQEDFDKLNKNFLIYFDSELCPKTTSGEIYMLKHLNDSERKVLLEQALKEFSPGEQMLFYLSIFIFYLDHLSDASVVLIIDEPEIHLHPKALVTLMKTLTDSRAVSQLWVASHSLFIMPVFEFEQIVHFDRNRICSLNRNTYKNIYNELIGIDNVDVFELLKSVENWSYYRFIVESFFLPISKSSTNKDDEQVQKFLHHLDSIRTNRPLKVLDYGAGKFRLWDCIKQAIPDQQGRAKFFQYEAFEPFPSKAVPEEFHFYSNSEDLKQAHYDVVVLMNVLHEINPCDWVETFHKIDLILSNGGVLIFLEVHTLTNGEQPYGPAGYLLLQDPQVKMLFSQATTVQLDEKLQEKSNCWIIPKQDLQKVTHSDVQDAISSLETYCEKTLKELDDQRIKMAHDANPADIPRIKLSGRKYAFWSQQYINAHFAKTKLTTTSSNHLGLPPAPMQKNKPSFPGIEISKK